MTTQSPKALPDIEFLDLIDACVGRIVGNEDFSGFLGWLADELPDHFGENSPPEREARLMLACQLGRQIWNATPLPSNHFRPRAIPAPGRNDRCLQGLACKHKQCCGAMPPFPAIRLEEIWILLAAHLPEQDLVRAVAERRVPEEALGAMARRFLEDGRPQRVVAMLEPMFSGSLERLDERHGEALYVLCDAYDALAEPRRKTELLKRVCAVGPAALRASAWQRLATIAMDEGDIDASWRAFREAQRADPDDPSLAHLEITLLVCSQRPDEARSRASFWLHQLKRLGYDDPRLLKFLEQAQAAPEAALADLQLGIAGDAPLRLRELIGATAARNIPAYVSRPADEISEDGAQDPLQGLRDQLRQMGVAQPYIEDTARKMAEDLDRLLAQKQATPSGSNSKTAPEPTDRLLAQKQATPSGSKSKMPPEPTTLFEAGDDAAFEAGDGAAFEAGDGGPADPGNAGECVLETPPELARVEQQWREVFRCAKPPSVSLGYYEGTDPWQDAAGWVDFLQRRPEAFDSLDILDDITAAVGALPVSEAPWIDQTVLQPLLERAARIIDAAHPGAGRTLPWGHWQNRPALRLLARLAFLQLRSGVGEAARAGLRKMLALNPNDNHGMRDELINELLNCGENQQALELVARYPDDAGAVLAFGAALAHFRLGTLKEAHKVLGAALRFHDKVPRYLIREQVARPRTSEFGVSFGGEDEAWIYRESMRETWASTPGALAWLKRESAAVKDAGGKRKGRKR